MPTGQPTKVPTKQPTPATAAPSGSPSASPSASPSGSPSAMPTTEPTKQPSAVPSGAPSQQPTTVPTRTPSFAPRPPEDIVQNLGGGFICVPEVEAVMRRALEGGEKKEEGTTGGDGGGDGSSARMISLKAPQRGLADFWTPDTCYAACLPRLAPQTSFVINIYYNANGDHVCTCCRECEGVRYEPR